MKKKESEDLKNQVIAGLLSNGFIETPDKWHGYHADGLKGPVDVSVQAEQRYKRRGYYVCIFGLFADPNKARAAGIDCNPFSGKYNFLFITSENVDYYISQYI